MKKPREPVKPRKPAEPSEPQKLLRAERQSVSVYSGMSLAEIIKATDGVNPEDVQFDATRGWYDDYDYQFEWEGKQKPNLRYEKDVVAYEKKMIKYQEDMEIYTKDIVIYNSSLKEYKSLNKQYLKWFHENELKKLG